MTTDPKPARTDHTLTVIALGGEPATGKTRLMRHLLTPYAGSTPFEHGLVRGHIYDTHPREPELVILGRYDDSEFAGTDTLPMNVMPDAKQFLTDIAKSERFQNGTIAFEGDRLFTDAFLSHALSLSTVDLRAYCLTCPPDELEQRHSAREDDQSESWLAGRRTKYENLREQYADTNWFHTHPHVTPADTADLAHELRAHFPPPSD